MKLLLTILCTILCLQVQAQDQCFHDSNVNCVSDCLMCLILGKKCPADAPIKNGTNACCEDCRTSVQHLPEGNPNIVIYGLASCRNASDKLAADFHKCRSDFFRKVRPHSYQAFFNENCNV
uniref:IGFBP N-terminal domain-containing protein n=1 Tax=Octopus bimaculoides TaxID=37653 RepID=A0A0L8ICL7_OCTBM